MRRPSNASLKPGAAGDEDEGEDEMRSLTSTRGRSPKTRASCGRLLKANLNRRDATDAETCKGITPRSPRLCGIVGWGSGSTPFLFYGSVFKSRIFHFAILVLAFWS